MDIVQHLDHQIILLPAASFVPNLLHALPQRGQDKALHILQIVVLVQGIPHLLGQAELLRLNPRLSRHYGGLHETLQTHLPDQFGRHAILSEGNEPAVYLRLQLVPVQQLQGIHYAVRHHHQPVEWGRFLTLHIILGNDRIRAQNQPVGQHIAGLLEG
ncbi:hypothetical protein D3C75_907170 [compost metagenome]